MSSSASALGPGGDLPRIARFEAVGVSKCSAVEIRHAAVARYGVPLATDQVHYSLVARPPGRSTHGDAMRRAA